MQVLVVDSMAHVRQQVTSLLRQHGYRVLTAATGYEAVEVVTQNAEIGVVICDLVLPGCDGPDLLRRVGEIARESDGESVKPPLVLLMISPTPRNERETLLSQPNMACQMGFEDVFGRPPERERLLAKLESLQSQFVPRAVSKSIDELRTGVDAVLESGDPHVMLEVRGELENQIHRLDVALEDAAGPEFLRRSAAKANSKKLTR